MRTLSHDNDTCVHSTGGFCWFAPTDGEHACCTAVELADVSRVGAKRMIRGEAAMKSTLAEIARNPLGQRSLLLGLAVGFGVAVSGVVVAGSWHARDMETIALNAVGQFKLVPAHQVNSANSAVTPAMQQSPASEQNAAVHCASQPESACKREMWDWMTSGEAKRNLEEDEKPEVSSCGIPDAGSVERYGTAVDFVATPMIAYREAARQRKLVLVLHISGNFEEQRFT